MGKNEPNKGHQTGAGALKRARGLEILKEKYDKYQSELDSKTRHHFGNCLSAVRIALGAFHAGEISFDMMNDLLDDMKKKELELGNPISFDYRDFFDQSIAFQEMADELCDEPLKARMSGRKILLADDECRKLGWDKLFEAIFGKDACCFAETPEETVSLVSEERDLALVYLDLKFPTSVEQGLKTLREIKTRRLDIPVVVFTADDRSRYVTKCLKHGADNYFAKQLEAEDRNSLAYFDKFREVTLSGLEKKRQKEVWLRIADLERTVEAEGPPFYRELFSYLRKAYFYLNLETEDLIYHTLFEKGATHFAEVIIQSGLALEYAIGLLYDQNKNNPLIKQLRKGTDTTLGKMIQALANINTISSVQRDACHEINELRTSAVHSVKKKGKNALTMDQAVAMEVLNKVIGLQKELVVDKIVNVNRV